MSFTLNRPALTYGFWIVLLPLLQALVFNHIYLFGFINPLVYILFIVIFPFDSSKTNLLILSFLLGFSIDLISNEGGIHTFALVFVAFFRLLILKIIKSETVFDDELISYRNLSTANLHLWIFTLIVLHHFIVFSLESFSFHLIGSVFIKTITTAVLTYIIVLFFLSVFFKKRTYEW
ncbi:MAG: rod shape-determining protein MreD [Flavobacteriia bacterium]|nr:MAG: rod shape-determining protein MreD [Flavobacteriia bacterium]